MIPGMEALVAGRHGDPFAILGPHGEEIRTLQPGARGVTIIARDSGAEIGQLEQVGSSGLFNGKVDRATTYLLRIDWPGEGILRDPQANIEMGAYYLTKLIGQFNNLAVALTAYNHGPGRVAELSEAKALLPMDYAEKVLSHYTP